MKQGSGNSRKGDSKVEPKPHSIGVGAVSRIGSQYVYTAPATPMHAGRGYKAPMHSQATHKGGSQGKH